MKAEVKLFAIAKQLAGTETVCCELTEPATVKELRAAILEQYPALTDVIEHVLFAIDTEYADDHATIRQGAEIACIPPVSGG
jgi:molybdopterin converting factor subunit 1